MGTTHFLLALHNHQPVGNFENVFREAFEKCYDPFLRFLEEHPLFRVSLHYSGCLLDWLEGREKQFLKRLVRLVRQNQVEILSGGYYEPILPLIPERDAVAQINYMNDYLRRRFGQDPCGFWLTERVWEQKLPRLIAETGLKYTVVDDTHFALAGLAENEITNIFITEEEGHLLYLFPIPKFLRYAIPFHAPDKAMEYLRKLSSSDSTLAVATYADDGEKFGLWPGTYQWVYREGWLDRFARTIEENRSWLILKTFREVIEEKQKTTVKKVYLPSSAYEEMAEWSLGREKGREFARLKRELEPLGVWNRCRVFFQGGIFKNFLVKYPEADWMRSRMRRVSRQVEAIKVSKRKKRAQQELWQGQCNCPYWHGIFGGLYLHHLRRSTYEHLNRAEALCNPPARSSLPKLTEEDLNQDGMAEMIIETPPFSFYFLPHRGGALAELDFHPTAMNLLDTLTRREEAYHQELAQRKEGRGEGRSIHELEKTIPSEILERAVFDSWDRFSLLDHFLPSATSFNEFWKGRFQSLSGDPTQVPYSTHWVKQKGRGTLVLTGEIPIDAVGGFVRVEKCIEVHPTNYRFEIFLKVTNIGPERLDCLWGTEWSFNCYDKERNEAGIDRVEVQDGWSPVHLEITANEPFDYWQFPIETVAQTEADFRLIHQGISIFPHWPLKLRPQQSAERALAFHISNRRK